MNNNFSCKQLLGRTITVYHATGELHKDLKRGYIGRDINLYCSLHSEGLLDLIKGMYRIVNNKKVYPTDYGLYKIDNVPTHWLYVDWETWSDIWYSERRRINTWNLEAQKVFGRIMDSKRTDRLVALKELYPLCKEIGDQNIIKENLGWLIIPRGRKLRVSKDNATTTL